VRTDPWETGFVDITGVQGLVGQVDGRTSAAVKGWLAARTPATPPPCALGCLTPRWRWITSIW
jgi:hypothetical protein